MGVPNAVASISKRWEEAQAARPVGPLPFIDPTMIPARRAACKLAEDAESGLIAIAQRIAADPYLQAYAWFLFWRVFVDPQPGYMRPGLELQHYLGEHAGSFHQLIELEFAPALARVHRARGYPAAVTDETTLPVFCHDANHRRGEGRPGTYAGQLPWVRMYLHDPYVRLGRLEFQLTTFAANATVTVWRRRSDRAVLALAVDGTRVDEAGLVLAESTAPGVGWVARCHHGDNAITGHLVNPSGRIVQRTMTLNLDEWDAVAKPGDDILSMHIPVGGAMDLELCVDSYRRARAFFATYHPDRKPKLIWSATWFLDPRLHMVLPADANPLRFQRSHYLHPVLPLASGGLWFVFLRKDVDRPESLPRDTSLRRALADFLAAGNGWNGGAGFVPLDEVDTLLEGRYTAGFDRLLAG